MTHTLPPRRSSDLRLRAKHLFYSQDLINILFSCPYTKIEFIQHDLKVSRLTATRYLDALAADGLLRKRKLGRSNYYINEPLFRILDRKSTRLNSSHSCASRMPSSG